KPVKAHSLTLCAKAPVCLCVARFREVMWHDKYKARCLMPAARRADPLGRKSIEKHGLAVCTKPPIGLGRNAFSITEKRAWLWFPSERSPIMLSPASTLGFENTFTEFVPIKGLSAATLNSPIPSAS